MKSSLPPNCLCTRPNSLRRSPKGVFSATFSSFSQRASFPCRRTSRSMPFISSSSPWGTSSRMVIFRSRIVRDSTVGWRLVG